MQTKVEMNKVEMFTVRGQAGLMRRIDAVLKGGEVRAAFVRTAIENEIKRRTSKPRQGEPGWSTATDAPDGVEG